MKKKTGDSSGIGGERGRTRGGKGSGRELGGGGDGEGKREDEEEDEKEISERTDSPRFVRRLSAMSPSHHTELPLTSKNAGLLLTALYPPLPRPRRPRTQALQKKARHFLERVLNAPKTSSDAFPHCKNWQYTMRYILVSPSNLTIQKRRSKLIYIGRPTPFDTPAASINRSINHQISKWLD